MHVCDLMVTFLRSGLKGKRHEEKGSDKSIGTEADGRGGENGQADYEIEQTTDLWSFNTGRFGACV